MVNITNQNIGGQKSRSASRKSKRGNNVDNNLKYVRITVFSRQIVIKDQKTASQNELFFRLDHREIFCETEFSKKFPRSSKKFQQLRFKR